MALSLCSTSVDNTGELACDKSRGVLKKLFIFNGTIPSASYADTQTFFDQLVTNSKLSKSATDKLFVLNEVQEITDSSEANKEGTLNLGFKATLQEGRPSYKAKVFAGGDLLKRLRTFNNQTIRILEYDANGVVWGTKSGTNFIGFQAKIFVSGNKIATGQNVEEGVVEITVSILSVSEYFDNAYWMETPSTANIEDVKPLVDAQLEYVSHVSNVLKYSLKIPGSNLMEDYDVLDDYGNTIATMDAQFAGSSGTTTAVGTALTITSITYDSATSTLVVTYDSTEYTAVGVSSYIRLSGPTPAQLDTADVVNLEILSVTHVKPA